VPFRGGTVLGGGSDRRGGDTGSGSALLGTRVLCATGHQIYALAPVPFARQTRRLIENGQVAEGLELFRRTRVRSDDPVAYDTERRGLYEHGGRVLVLRGAFADAFRLFARAGTAPEGVVSLYEGLLPAVVGADRANRQFETRAGAIVDGPDDADADADADADGYDSGSGDDDGGWDDICAAEREVVELLAQRGWTMGQYI
jgi:hypothetical protein